MKFLKLGLQGVWLIEPELFSDERGVLRRHYCEKEFGEHGLAPMAVQGNISENPHLATLRGFHYQVQPFEEAKTLSCMSGAIFGIVVDLRIDMSSFMKWIAVEISAQERGSLHVPAGCAIAWITTEPNTTLHYYMSEFYSPDSYRGIRYNDPLFDFRWPMQPRVISEKDRTYPDFDPNSLRGD
jgi:dTDP-4-dehydrorhamnose 3,5-epimerase